MPNLIKGVVGVLGGVVTCGLSAIVTSDVQGFSIRVSDISTTSIG